ncbi:MAG: DUF4429 domain-containing protein [Streptosporangiaceae bacterium]|jgi:hypothetical protein
MSEILRAKGQNGQIEFDGRNVTIKRGGFYGTMTVGRGDKVIPVQSITGVRYRKASLGGTVRGFIEFTVPGATERRTRAGRQAVDEIHNENAVVILRPKHNPDFETIRDAVLAAIEHSNTSTEPPADDASTALRKLVDLHDSGLLSDDEFTAKRAEIIKRI